MDGGALTRVAASAPKPVQIAAAIAGNWLESYDFLVFGSFALAISQSFFPAGSQYASLLLTTATFGVGFFMRPVGGVLLGIYADRQGRKAALVLIVALMTLSMAMLAFAPTYAAIGLAAPLLVVAARLVQGFAAGGEFPSATSFLVESAPANRRGFYGSWVMAGQGIAVLTAALLGALVARTLSSEAVAEWGWRIPFAIGLAIGPLGLFIRRRVDETDAFLHAQKSATPAPLAEMLRPPIKAILASMGIVTFATISFYVTLLYMPTFVATELHLPLGQAFTVQSVAVAGMVALTPLFGILSDRVGRRPVLIGALVLSLGLTYPLFHWVYAGPSLARLTVMQLVLCGLLGAYYGPMSTAVAEQFGTTARSTGVGIAYNFAVMIFGGFAQFFVIWLIEITGSPIAPSFYLIFGAALALIASFFLTERSALTGAFE